MDFIKIGRTSTVPPTIFFWEKNSSTTVEITSLENFYLIRATKTYRILKQFDDGRETWQKKLTKLNRYLSTKFSNFRISVDYSTTVTPEIVNDPQDIRISKNKAENLLSERKKMDQEIRRLEKSLSISLDSFEDNVSNRLKQLGRKREVIEDELDELTVQLNRKRDIQNEWSEKGVLTAILFQYSTDPKLVFSDKDLEDTIVSQTDLISKSHHQEVIQTLPGPNWRLNIEEVEEPRVFTRYEHTNLLTPETLKKLKEDYNLSEKSNKSLERLQEDQIRQYEAYAVNDLTIDGATVERSKATPAEAVSSILQQLETQQGQPAVDAPNEGPMVGTVAGTKQVVGFDPSELSHLYIVGESGSGKSHLKRVLIENVASLNYNVLTINPGDTQNIGLSLSNENIEDGSSILFNQYWIGDDRFLNKPDDLTEFFTGWNAVTLQGLPSDEKQDFINDVFTKLSEIDSTDQPLFVFLDEAHNFNQGAAANSIQKIARESRKFGVNLVIASQSPTDYSYNQRHVRENTTKIFLNGEYFDYADNFLDDGNQISRLDKGQCIVPETRDLPRMTIDIRDVLTRFWEHTPSEDEIKKVAQRFEKQIPDFEDQSSRDQELSYNKTRPEDPEPDLTEDEEKVVEAIQDYIRGNDERPSKNKTVESSPFGTGKTSRILDQLLEKSAVRKDTETRYGNEAQVFSISFDN